MMIEELKERLREELLNELPGELAHSIMMPKVHSDKIPMPADLPSPTKSAVLILFYPDDYGHIKFPLIQRPIYNGAHSAQVSLPGGKQEQHDQDLIQTALREAQEEIGIIPSNVEIIGSLSDIVIWVSNYVVKPVIGFMDMKPLFQKDEQEVEAIIETDIFDIIDPSKRKEGTVRARDKYRIQTPYFEIDSRVVWGATAMMLSELSVVIGNTKIF